MIIDDRKEKLLAENIQKRMERSASMRLGSSVGASIGRIEPVSAQTYDQVQIRKQVWKEGGKVLKMYLFILLDSLAKCGGDLYWEARAAECADLRPGADSEASMEGRKVLKMYLLILLDSLAKCGGDLYWKGRVGDLRPGADSQAGM